MKENDTVDIQTAGVVYEAFSRQNVKMIVTCQEYAVRHAAHRASEVLRKVGDG